jgi:hypothetical protein
LLGADSQLIDRVLTGARRYAWSQAGQDSSTRSPRSALATAVVFLRDQSPWPHFCQPWRLGSRAHVGAAASANNPIQGSNAAGGGAAILGPGRTAPLRRIAFAINYQMG